MKVHFLKLAIPLAILILILKGDGQIINIPLNINKSIIRKKFNRNTSIYILFKNNIVSRMYFDNNVLELGDSYYLNKQRAYEIFN